MAEPAKAQVLWRVAYGTLTAVERLRPIIRLRRDLGVNLAGIAAILEMRDRLRAV